MLEHNPLLRRGGDRPLEDPDHTIEATRDVGIDISGLLDRERFGEREGVAGRRPPGEGADDQGARIARDADGAGRQRRRPAEEDDGPAVLKEIPIREEGCALTAP